MIRFEKEKVMGFKEAIRGMRNPLNSWKRSDSKNINSEEVIGPDDAGLMKSLVAAGRSHAKFRRMIVVYVDIIAPLYWWKEFDTYKVGTVANSCSTMHKLAERDLTLDDFSREHLFYDSTEIFRNYIEFINSMRQKYINSTEKNGWGKEYWWQMIQLLPSSYNQKRTVMMNYEVLSNIYETRREHKLGEWNDFCKWVEQLPNSFIITHKLMGGVT